MSESGVTRPREAQYSDVIVVGGGAAGMMAAIAASGLGVSVCVLEKNEKTGKKLYITGKGRCNLTNSCPREDIPSHILSNSRFMYSSLNSFDNEDTISFFEGLGVPLKIERGSRVFPVSDHSSDIIRALDTAMREKKVRVRLHSDVKELILEDGRCTGARLMDGREYRAGAVIVATGGRSYPATGSTGDGYVFAKAAGHEVTNLYPGLVPLNASPKICGALQGLSLRNINALIARRDDNTPLYSGFGELLFTHYGLSGPLILTASSEIDPERFNEGLVLHIDLKPALDHGELDARVLRDFEEVRNKEFRNALDRLFPSKLIPVIIELAGIDPDKRVNEVTREERKRLVEITKDMRIDISSLRGFGEAVITRGGVSVKEIDPKTMESKIVKGLYFAGEVLDVDAHTGGYNLQIAWSTGHAAGSSAAINALRSDTDTD
ncbi:MAG: NAD(P)/FAD-dependent oxidoreductase [Lachnospiraceae bacterium]|nr:NAD(P)/FAD-dependent oxidoreductase [Lachnospiraceae bacterium]